MYKDHENGNYLMYHEEGFTNQWRVTPTNDLQSIIKQTAPCPQQGGKFILINPASNSNYPMQLPSESWSDCSIKCLDDANCKYWQYNQVCQLLIEFESIEDADNGYIIGSRDCKGNEKAYQSTYGQCPNTFKAKSMWKVGNEKFFDKNLRTTSSKCQGSNADMSCCTSSSPCKEDEGDCDTANDCESGLVCGNNNCPFKSGFPDSDYDCCEKPSGIFSQCVKEWDPNQWCLQQGLTIPQHTRCESVTNNGNTCVNPTIKYGSTEEGIPQNHESPPLVAIYDPYQNSWQKWCEQLGGTYKSHTLGQRTGFLLKGCRPSMPQILSHTYFDDNIWHWCDSADGFWYKTALDNWGTASDAVTSITCG